MHRTGALGDRLSSGLKESLDNGALPGCELLLNCKVLLIISTIAPRSREKIQYIHSHRLAAQGYAVANRRQ